MIKKQQIIIPKEELPEKMPSNLQDLYTFDIFGKDDGEKLTETDLKKLVKKIKKAKKFSILLGPNPDIETTLEEEYLQLEIDGAWIFIQLVIHDTYPDSCLYSSFDPDYLDSDEESPMRPGDGQSVILKRNTMHDSELAANCIEYYVRTRKLYPGMAWLKQE